MKMPRDREVKFLENSWEFKISWKFPRNSRNQKRKIFQIQTFLPIFSFWMWCYLYLWWYFYCMQSVGFKTKAWIRESESLTLEAFYICCIFSVLHQNSAKMHSCTYVISLFFLEKKEWNLNCFHFFREMKSEIISLFTLFEKWKVNWFSISLFREGKVKLIICSRLCRPYKKPASVNMSVMPSKFSTFMFSIPPI